MSKRDSQRLSRMYMGDDGDKSLMSQLADQAVKEKEKEKPKKRKECTEKITPFKKIGYEDMTKMEDMTLEAVLGNLKERYEQDLIYTYTSSILVAINPFKRLNCFTPGWVKHYKGKRLGLLSPHIFAVAEQAYANMIDHKVNQSVLVSGESGAGKTESTKLIMQFLSARTDRVSNIETMVLESIPVLEAFGNAKTGRNDNSSRFGKFIELQFSSEHYIVGSRMLTYLLEKSRLTFQAKGERNFHIFYQLCAASDAEEKAVLKLEKAEHYHFLNQSGCTTIKGVDEKEEFSQLKQALTLFEISKESQMNMFKIVATVLHLGNITFAADGDKAKPSGDDAKKELAISAELLGVDAEALQFALTHKKIKMRSEIIQKPMTPQQATDQTSALAKYLYSTLFDWMVAQLNVCTNADQYNQYIGVLDIFGFELFEINSLEQFLINFANEKLQQFFNHHIFKLEQAIYEAEKIDWTLIEFKDNQECLDLIEQRRPPGILAIVDEESKFPRATDETLIAKLHDNFDKKHSYYDKPRLARMNFIVKHFAGAVDYQVTDWREKNKDELPEHLVDLVRNSQTKWIAILYADEAKYKAMAAGLTTTTDNSDDKKKKDSGKMTVGAQFKQQLIDLMTMLGTTEPYFIRCVKPNAEKVCNKFNEELIYNQLLYAGMMETIRIRQMGYPIRYSLDDFWKRYRVICPEIDQVRGDPAKTAHTLLKALGIEVPKMAQVGLTKVFMKDHINAELEDRRNVALTGVIMKMQNWWRFASNRAMFIEQRKNAVTLQVWWRYAIRRKQFNDAHNAAVRTQAWYRMMLALKLKKKLLEKKRKEEEAKRKKEEEERKKMIAKYGEEEAKRMEEEKKAAEMAELRGAAAAVTLKEDEEEARKKAEEEAKKAAKKEKEKKSKVKRDKRGSIIMKKDQEIEIPIDVDGKVTLGLGWKGGQWDMDASVLMFRYKQHRDDIYYYKPRSKDNAVVHRGGYAGFIRTNPNDGEKDAEQIDLDLRRVSAKTNTLLFVVTVFSPEGNFSTVEDAYCRLLDQGTNQEYCRYTLEQSGDETAKVMCKLYRYGFSKWRLKALGAPGEGRLYKHMIPYVQPFLDPEPPKRRFKIKIHRGKYVDVKSQYRGTTKAIALNTFIEIRFDYHAARSKIIKKSLTPQYKTSKDIYGHGTIIEANVMHRQRFGKDVFLARALIPLQPNMAVKEQWYKLEARDKAKGRGQTAVTGEIKLSIQEI